jgi:hypothetical protein
MSANVNEDCLQEMLSSKGAVTGNESNVEQIEQCHKIDNDDDDDWDPCAVKIGVLNRKTIDCSGMSYLSIISLA